MPASTSSPSALSDWFASSVVTDAMTVEQAELIPLLAGHIGVRGLYLRPAMSVSRELSGNMLQSVTALYPGGEGWDGDVRCEDDSLPLGSETFSLIYLLHVLEQHAQPEALLRECARCLQPEGLLVAVVFNPWSAFRVRWPPGGLQSLGVSRVQRMLRDCGLTPEQDDGVGPLLPLRSVAGSGHAVPPRRNALSHAFLSSRAVVARRRKLSPTLVGPSTARLRAPAISP
jgi:SAM-dependent methyltransferase